MQIQGLARQLTNPLGLLTGASNAEDRTSSSANVEQAGAPAADAAKQSASFREILSRYDVRRITPREFSDMLNELHQAGELTDDEFKELSLARLEFDRERVDDDTPIDLIEFFRQKLSEAHETLQNFAGATEGNADIIAEAKAIRARAKTLLDWFEKFATVQASNQRDPIDFLA